MIKPMVYVGKEKEILTNLSKEILNQHRGKKISFYSALSVWNFAASLKALLEEHSLHILFTWN